jgi:prophage tail gpP-like protein
MIYTAKAGDTLASIATKYLRDPNLASLLWTVNALYMQSGTPSIVTAGDLIEIPDQLMNPHDPIPSGLDEDTVYVLVNGEQYSGWETARISRSLESVAGTFEFTTSDRWDNDMESWMIDSQDAIRVVVGSDLVLTGYVDRPHPRLSSGEHAFSVMGRDKQCDIVDCSAVNRPGEWRNKKVEQIANDICRPYGVVIIADVDTGGIVPLFRIQPGEKCFEALERLAKARSLMLSGDPSGNIHLKTFTATPLGITLQEGVNILEAEYENDVSLRYSHYIVEGQGIGQDKQSHQMRQTADDPDIERYRVLDFQAGECAGDSYGSNRADWEARVRGARGETGNILVPGWRDDQRRLWAVDTVVAVDCPSCKMQGEFLINEVEFLKSRDGTTTRLQLRSPKFTWKYKRAKRHKSLVIDR